FTEVSIDDVMAAAGLTRGGFYNHFKTKEDLYVETLAVYAAERREETPNDLSACGPDIAREMLNRYISRQHLDNVDGHCPLMALPSDVARAGPNVRAAYQGVLEVMVQLFEGCLEAEHGMSVRQRGLAMAATCVGAMVLSRTIDDANFADEICEVAQKFAADGMV
ncbi:MAG: TetR/AcrR family transcriptional regulator, partial [Geminicoccaceae bacterium]